MDRPGRRDGRGRGRRARQIGLELDADIGDHTRDRIDVDLERHIALLRDRDVERPGHDPARRKRRRPEAEPADRHGRTGHAGRDVDRRTLAELAAKGLPPGRRATRVVQVARLGELERVWVELEREPRGVDAVLPAALGLRDRREVALGPGQRGIERVRLVEVRACVGEVAEAKRVDAGLELARQLGRRARERERREQQHEPHANTLPEFNAPARRAAKNRRDPSRDDSCLGLMGSWVLRSGFRLLTREYGTVNREPEPEWITPPGS